MIYLLFGEDRKSAGRNLQKFIDRFHNEVPFAWHGIDCGDENARQKLEEVTAGQTLFGKKTYLVIKNPSLADDDSVDVLNKKLKTWEKDDSIVVFYERGIPLKNKLFDTIKKRASKIQEFSPMTKQKLLRYIEDEGATVGRKIPENAIRYLVTAYQENPEKFEGELEKILLEGEFEKKDNFVEQRELFVLGDLWGRRARHEAYFHFEKLVRAGFEPENVLRTLLWHVRNVCFAQTGKTKELKPFVAEKAKKQAQNFSHNELYRAQEALVLWSDPRQKENLETRLLHFLLTY